MAILAGGTFAGQAITLLTAPISSRLYSPEDFGVLALFVAVSTVILTVSSLRYELAILLPDSDEEARDVLGLALLLNLVVALLALGLVPLVGVQVGSALGSEEFSGYLWLVPLVILVGGTYQALAFGVIRAKQFRPLATTRVYQASGQASTNVGLGLAGVAPLGLLVGALVARAAGLLRLAQITGTIGWRRGARPRAASMRQVALRYRRFPIYSTWAGLMSGLRTELPTVLMSAIYGPAAAGWYLLSSRLVTTPATLAGNSLADVYVSEAAQLVRTDPKRLYNLFRQTNRRLFRIAIGPTILLVLLAPWLFSFALGAEWSEAGEYARLLAPAVLLQLVTAPLSNTLMVLEEQAWQLVFNAGRLALVVGVFVGSDMLELNARFAVFAYSVVSALSYLFLLVLLRVKLQAVAAAAGRGDA